MDISADIASRITRLFQMSCLVVGIAPYIPGSVSPCDQVILLVVSIGAAVAALVLHADQIIAVVICIPAFGVVPVYDPDRQTSVIIRNLLFRSIGVSDTVHASARIIGHLRAVPDRVCLLNQSAVLIITVLHTFQQRLKSVYQFQHSFLVPLLRPRQQSTNHTKFPL